MRTSIKGIELIKYFEGFSAKPYLCASGRKTIGYGHLIKRGEEFTSISKAEAAALLKKDILRAEASVMKNIKVPLNCNQFDALVSFTFNVGGASLQRSSLRSKINSHADDNLIYHEFTRWVYAKGRKSKGLIFRREIEANLFLK